MGRHQLCDAGKNSTTIEYLWTGLPNSVNFSPVKSAMNNNDFCKLSFPFSIPAPIFLEFQLLNNYHCYVLDLLLIIESIIFVTGYG